MPMIQRDWVKKKKSIEKSVKHTPRYKIDKNIERVQDKQSDTNRSNKKKKTILK
jgi:hypothetical protein